MKSSLVLLGASAVPVLGETILGLTVFTRHGDRNSKTYSGYGLTSLGFQQNFQVGSVYRDIYLSSNSSKQILGISEDKYVPSQLYASAPSQKILSNTATAFLQGLYPPLEGTDPEVASITLNNGTEYTNPLGGYQYVFLNGVDENTPNTIWIKGDDGCPAYTEAADTFVDSAEFKERDAATRDFYAKFWPQLEDVFFLKESDLNYKKAFDIFDLINVAQIHNTSEVERVSSEDLFQLRTLADSAEFALNYNTSQPGRSIHAQTLSGAILKQLNQTVSTKGKLKFSLLAGSYDTFLAFFGITQLTRANPNFFGLPHYASTLAFEILTDEDVEEFPSNTDDLKVRFLFRNGSDIGAPLTAFPLFGQSETVLPWTEFVEKMGDIAITSPDVWCSSCRSTEDFCAVYNSTLSTGSINPPSGGGSKMSNAVAGVIGAAVTLGAVLIAGLLFWLIRRRKSSAAAPVSPGFVEKGSISS